MHSGMGRKNSSILFQLILVFTTHNFSVLVHSHCFHLCFFQPKQAAVSNERALKTVCTLPAQHQTADKISD